MELRVYLKEVDKTFVCECKNIFQLNGCGKILFTVFSVKAKGYVFVATIRVDQNVETNPSIKQKVELNRFMDRFRF